jgi:hypothetical protein
MNEKERAIREIVAMNAPDETPKWIIVLCVDGTLWRAEIRPNGTFMWAQMRPPFINEVTE